MRSSGFITNLFCLVLVLALSAGCNRRGKKPVPSEPQPQQEQEAAPIEKPASQKPAPVTEKPMPKEQKPPPPKTPCAEEFIQKCKTPQDCLYERPSKFSAICRDEIMKLLERQKQIQNACRIDINRYCKPGQFFLEAYACLRANGNKISINCRMKLPPLPVPPTK